MHLKKFMEASDDLSCSGCLEDSWWHPVPGCLLCTMKLLMSGLSS